MHGHPEGHIPSAGYLCQRCRDAWPCERIREVLLEEFQYAPTVLVAYMAGHLDAARQFSLDLDAERMQERFIGWALPPAA